jgi:ferredoxin
MSVIYLIGKASNTTTELTVSSSDLNKSLLNYLQKKDIPIASSCRGVGSCCLCCFNGTKLTCQEQVSEYLDKSIEIDYL